jgi:hypothetical protein
MNVPFDLMITFNEPVNGFVAGDITLTGPATLSLAGDDGDTEYVVTITPNPTDEGDVTVQVDANAVQDFALNDNTAASNTVSVFDLTITFSFDLTITFSEPVNGFAADDVTVTGPAAATSASGGDTVYTLTITPDTTAEGDVTVTVNANTVQGLPCLPT